MIGLSLSVRKKRFGSGLVFSLFNDFKARVVADGGSIEADTCTMANFRMPYFDYWQTYQTRVTGDGGVIEGADCLNQVIRDLKR